MHDLGITPLKAALSYSAIFCVSFLFLVLSFNIGRVYSFALNPTMAVNRLHITGLPKGEVSTDKHGLPLVNQRADTIF